MGAHCVDDHTSGHGIVFASEFYRVERIADRLLQRHISVLRPVLPRRARRDVAAHDHCDRAASDAVSVSTS